MRIHKRKLIFPKGKDIDTEFGKILSENPVKTRYGLFQWQRENPGDSLQVDYKIKIIVPLIWKPLNIALPFPNSISVSILDYFEDDTQRELLLIWKIESGMGHDFCVHAIELLESKMQNMHFVEFVLPPTCEL